MATVKEQADPGQSPRASGSTSRKSSVNLERHNTPRGAELSAVNSRLSGPDSPATTTATDASSPRAGSDPPKLTIQPGNAFSIKAFREAEEHRLVKKSPGKCYSFGPFEYIPPCMVLMNAGLYLDQSFCYLGSSVASSSFEEARRPCIQRKPSFGLDYDEELALPMPKPRHFRPDLAETTPVPEEEEDKRPHLLKKRAVTEPTMTGASRSEPTTPEDNKKKSRFELIKSKLSFKDLRKESLKDEISSPIPCVPDVPTLMSSENAKPGARRPLAHSGIPALSPNSYNFRAKLKPVELTKSPTTGGITGTPSQINPTPSKIPLPPSGTLSNAHGTTASVRIKARRLACPVEQGAAHVDNHGDQVDSQNIPAPEFKCSTSAPNAGPEPDIMVARPSLEQKFTPSTPSRPSFEHPLIDDSPPKAADLLEGSGKVKYLPRHWIVKEDGAASPSQQMEPSVPTAYKNGEPPVESLPDYMMSFKERLEQANIPFDKPIPPEIQNRSIAAHIDDIVDMVRSIERHAEKDIHNVNMKLDELSSWIGGHLKNEVGSISDLARGNSDLFAKQYEVSKEMMKFQLDIRTEIGVMERRLNIFEMKVIDELQSEMRSIIRSQEELTRKNEAREAKLLAQSEDTRKYMEEMRRQTEEIEKEVEELQNKGVHPKFLKLEEKLAMLQNVFGRQIAQTNVKYGCDSTDLKPQLFSPASVKTIVAANRHEHRGESISGDDEMKTQQPPVDMHLPVAAQLAPTPSAQSDSAQSRVAGSVQSKSTSMFPRSVSLSRQGILRSMKGGVGTPEEPKDKDKSKEKSSEQTPAEDTKKWHVFGFRRRRRMSDSAGSNSSKFNWPASRRTKEASTANEGSSSRASTPPVPPIPRMIPQMSDKVTEWSSSHPLVRNAVMKKAQHESETQSAQAQPITAGLIQTHVPHEESSTHDSGQTSFCTTSSFGENKLSTSSVISPDSFHSAQDKHDTDLPAYSAVDDNLQAPLLRDNDQEWDRVSLRESQYREPFV